MICPCSSLNTSPDTKLSGLENKPLLITIKLKAETLNAVWFDLEVFNENADFVSKSIRLFRFELLS